MRFPGLTTSTAVVLVPLLAVALAACGEDDSRSRAVDGPTTLQTESPPTSADGFERVECDLTAGDRELTVALDVPAGSEAQDAGGEPRHSCVFTPPAEDLGEFRVYEVRVVLLHDDFESNEERDVATLADLEEGFDERYGEEAVYDVEWEQDVVVFGETVGNRLTWTSEYEGTPEWDFRAEAEGVQVWLTAQGEDFDGSELEQTFEQVIASVRRG